MGLQIIILKFIGVFVISATIRKITCISCNVFNEITLHSPLNCLVLLTEKAARFSDERVVESITPTDDDIVGIFIFDFIHF